MSNETAKAKKWKNLEDSTQLLKANNIPFESCNQGVHLVVQGREESFDFWPSTGKFIGRTKKVHRRGVFELLKLCSSLTEELPTPIQAEDIDQYADENIGLLQYHNNIPVDAPTCPEEVRSTHRHEARAIQQKDYEILRRNFLYIEKTTKKAKFFVTVDDTFHGILGFWCPNAAVIETKGKQLTLEEWFTPSEEEYERR